MSEAPIQKCYLLGHPVRQSLSPLIHNTAASSLGLSLEYEALDVGGDALQTAVSSIDGRTVLGANVTIPHKQTVIPYLDGLDESASRVGAVNTIVVREGQRIGFNTDVAGFLAPLNSRIDNAPESVLILGAGGAARAVVVAAHDYLKARTITVVSRRPEQARAVCNTLGVGKPARWENVGILLQEASLVVNTTPVGMWPYSDAELLPDAQFRSDQIVYDLIYKPDPTSLMISASAQGAEVIGGMPMLIGQAAASFVLWTGQKMPIETVKRAVQRHLQSGNVS